MKKTRFILLALVAAMVLMGAGYAAWSQTFEINSRVSTGELFVMVSDEGITSVIVDANGNGKYDDEEDIDITADNAGANYLEYPTVATFSGDSSREDQTTLSRLEYTIEQLYPGTQVTSQVKFKNLGTIKAKVSGEGKSVTDNAIWDELIIKVGDDEISGETRQEKLDNLANAVAAAIGDTEPGDEATVTIVQELPITSGNETENINEFFWQIMLTFEQYNAPTE